MDDQLDLIDGYTLAEQSGRAAVADLARAVMSDMTPGNTAKAFRSDWATWTEFVEVSAMLGAPVELVPDRPGPDPLVVFAGWLGKGGRRRDGSLRTPLAPESIRRKLTGVLAGWREHGVEPPRGITKPARDWVALYEKKLIEANLPTGRGEAPYLSIEQLQAIAATTPDTLIGLRDMAIVTVGMAIGGRSAELAHLDVSDLTAHPRGMYVHVRQSKTHHRKPRVKFGEHDRTCPVLRWRRWRNAAQLVTGPAFRALDRHGNLGPRMHPEDLADRITAAGERAHLVDEDGDPVRLTGHSLRSGFATAAKQAGKQDWQIADQAGWGRGSRSMQRYIRDVTDWDDNVLDGIGL